MPTVYCSLFNFLKGYLGIRFRGFKKITGLHLFFDKAFIWTIYKKSFRFGRLSLGYVVCFVSVYTISCCLQCRVLVAFAYARTEHRLKKGVSVSVFVTVTSQKPEYPQTEL